MNIVVGAGTVLIVGAGLAGLVAAHALGDAGRSAVLVDKGRSPGGRLATRRLAGARLDHGAQFFTVRSPDFAEIVHDWRRAGLVREWCRGFTPEGDGYPRYVIEGGMNTAAKYLASSLEVHCNVNIASIAADARSGITVATTGGTTWHVDAAIVTAPVPQALALLDAGATAIDRQRRSLLDSVEYVPCFALMVVLDGPSAIPFPGGVQDGDPLFSFIGDNMAKGVSDLAAVTFHTNAGRPERSTNTSASVSSSGTVAAPKRRMPALSPSAARSACPSAMPMSSTVW